MRRKLKLISDGGGSGSKKCNRWYTGTYGGVQRYLCLTEVSAQAANFVLVIWRESGFSRREDVFIFELVKKITNFTLKMLH
jgi:hypothetical protein